MFEQDPVEDAEWGARWEWGALPGAPFADAQSDSDEHPELPAWLEKRAPEEPRPPKPLAPSGLGETEGSDPPIFGADASFAARRGVLIHALLERLPAVELDQREGRTETWLARNASDLDEAARTDIVQSALRVISDEAFAPVFAPNALAEIPLSAVVGGQVIAGIADRLLVTEDAVTVIDFKTARRPPLSIGAIPGSTMKQLAAYVAALKVIYPGRTVKAGVLYTQTPELFSLTESMLSPYNARFTDAHESFAMPELE